MSLVSTRASSSLENLGSGILAHLRRRIGDKKWKEARERSLARIKNPRFDTKRLGQTMDSTPTKAAKRIAARFYQLKTGHALTATHLKWIKLREDDQCWWCCRLGQTWEHLFKHCTRWRAQQKAMWAKVEKDTKRAKHKWMMAELFADERCSEAVLEFLRTADVGRKAPVEGRDGEHWSARGASASAGCVVEQDPHGSFSYV